jgi:hypothetical protein
MNIHRVLAVCCENKSKVGMEAFPDSERRQEHRFNRKGAQALVSFKIYMPPPLPYFKVNIYPFLLPTFDLFSQQMASTRCIFITTPFRLNRRSFLLSE